MSHLGDFLQFKGKLNKYNYQVTLVLAKMNGFVEPGKVMIMNADFSCKHGNSRNKV